MSNLPFYLMAGYGLKLIFTTDTVYWDILKFY